MTYTPIIGLEIHAELQTNSKMFCGCKNDPFHAPKPNMYTCPVCLGMPGALPVANKKAVEWTIKLGLALGSKIALLSKFDRKHYFYPDLAKGYQISQYDQPLCKGGLVSTELGDVRIRRVHLEEDTGKLQHITLNGKAVSLIDFNRSGVPLVEIVTEPDIHSAQHAKAYAQKIQEIIRTLGISTADMEKGSMRLEANISLSSDGKTLPPYKVEAKNINSFRFLEQAITYEIKRQTEILESGKIPMQETRGWNEMKRATIPQRSKEEAEDYRYFPDPDLPPMEFTQAYVEELCATLPELPDVKVTRYEHLGIKSQFAALLASSTYNSGVVDTALELAIKEKIEPNAVASYIVNKKIDTHTTSAAQIIKDVQAQSSFEVVDEKEVEQAITSVITEQAKAVADYKAGRTAVLGFLIGMVMKKVGKKVDPKQINDVLVKKLHI